MKKYDYILPIGESCITSYNLRKRNLQVEAYPFDWLMDFKLDKFVYYYKSDFNDFLLRDNLKKYLDIPPTSCEHYIDSRTKILFVHCFKKNAELSDFDEVKEKFVKRIDRFKKRFNSRKVLLIYTSKTDDYSDDELLKLYEQLKTIKKYGVLDILYVLTVPDPYIYIYNHISEHIVKVTMSYSNDGLLPGQGDGKYWKGIQEFWDKLLSDYALTFKWKKTFFKIIACFIPIKKIKKKLRKV